MPAPLTEPPTPDLDAFAAHAADMLGLTLDPAWTAAVVANLRVLREAADLVGAFPLPDEAEAAPVFTA